MSQLPACGKDIVQLHRLSKYIISMSTKAVVTLHIQVYHYKQCTMMMKYIWHLWKVIMLNSPNKTGVMTVCVQHVSLTLKFMYLPCVFQRGLLSTTCNKNFEVCGMLATIYIHSIKHGRPQSIQQVL